MIHATLVAPDVAPLLWHGSLPPLGRELHDSGFELLVLCNREPYLAPRLFPGVEVLRCPLRDAEPLSVSDLRLATVAAERAAARHACCRSPFLVIPRSLHLG
jgi:hypothetical protein